MREDAINAPSADGPAPEVPDFELIRPIGEGGFGQVWLGRNRTTGRLRAVKLIPLRHEGRTDPAGREIVSLTQLEARIGSHHPNLMVIHHVGKTADHLFYVMDLADDASGSALSCDPGYRPATLEHRLEDAPLVPDECLRLGRQLVGGLAGLHEAGMVHRDVKPSNCLFVEGELKLADFGLLTDADRQASRVGTRGYMPPDGRMDMRADVYAAGLVIYEMLSGLPAERFPHLGETVCEFGKDADLQMLNRLVLKACQPDPNRRYRDARAMTADLGPPEGQAAAAKPRLSLLVAVSAVTCLVVMLAGSACVWWLTRPPRVNVNFITEPLEATVYLDDAPLPDPDGDLYRTPCTILNLPARSHHVVFRHESLGELDVGRVDFAETREIVASWHGKPDSGKPVAAE
jgi:serine/threonine protein kinase